MHFASFESAEFQEAWIEGDESTRWRSAPAHGPGTGAAASGSSLLEVDPGARLAPHTDSAEETVVVVSGEGTIQLEGQSQQLAEGAIAVVPANARHEVANAGEGLLRFVAVYADTDVTTTYEADVQPDGGRERQPVA